MILLIIFAFVAGIVTILSPCILPVLPLILAVPDGSQDNHKPYGVVTGFVLSFTVFTLFLSTLVKLLGIPSDTMRYVSITIIIFFGISLIFPSFQLLIEKLFSRISGFTPQTINKNNYWSGVILGFSLGLLWTPCVGPILASIISLAVAGRVTLDTFFITLSYSLGTALPMFIIIKTGNTLFLRLPSLKKNLSSIQRVFGVIMIVTAVLIYLGLDRSFQSYILQKFPGYGAGLTKLETNNEVSKSIENLKEVKVKLDNKGLAPELTVGGKWFNLPSGVSSYTLESLRGKVVLVDFWTYSCINCIRTLPYLKDWWNKYKDQGLVIIGVHSPEFEFEKSADNVAKAVKDFGITYPVMQDNDFATWRAYDNHYWPAKYFVDKDGKIRSTHFGEGDYDESEKIIQELLAESGHQVDMPISNPSYTVQTRTPETYLGYDRTDGLASPERIIPDQKVVFTSPISVPNNSFSYKGEWLIASEFAEPSSGSELSYAYEAKSVYLVMNPIDGGGRVEVYLDGVKKQELNVNVDKLYTLVELESPGKHVLKLVFPDGKIKAFAFTFG